MGLDGGEIQTNCEAWLDVEGYEYQVSSLGKVRNKKTGRILRNFPTTSGYLKVTLHKNGSQKTVFVHRLVAFAFCDGYYYGAVVDHIDGNILNNKATNLRWVSQLENVYDSFKRGRQRRPAKRVIQILNGQVVGEFQSVCEAFRQTGIRHISEVATGKRHSAGGYQWCYQKGRG